MSTSVRREVRTTTRLKAKLTELGYQRRQSASSIVSEIVARFAAGKLKPPEPPADLDALVRFTNDGDVWDQALDRAKRENVNLSEVIRAELEVVTRDITL